MIPGHNKAFLSYQEGDKEFVEALGSHLRRNGVDVFFDKWDIQGGDSVPQEIEEAYSCTCCLLHRFSETSLGFC